MRLQEPVYYGGALNYHGANPDAIIERMKRKAEAGCGYFLSQPVYTEKDVERLTYIKEHIDTKLMCGITKEENRLEIKGQKVRIVAMVFAVVSLICFGVGVYFCFDAFAAVI